MNYLIFLIYSLILNTAVSPGSTVRKIIIDKPTSSLFVVQGEDTIATFPVALGVNYGQKRYNGDRKTPEGKFTIASIEDSREWEGDASGSDYGPWFMRLTGKWRSIGIHGTNLPASIGTRASLGCIRLHNSDLLRLHKLVNPGTEVVIHRDTITTNIPLPPGTVLKPDSDTGRIKKLTSGKRNKRHRHHRYHLASRRRR